MTTPQNTITEQQLRDLLADLAGLPREEVTRQTLAAALGASDATIHRRIKSQEGFSTDELLMMADYLNINRVTLQAELGILNWSDIASALHEGIDRGSENPDPFVPAPNRRGVALKATVSKAKVASRRDARRRPNVTEFGT